MDEIVPFLFVGSAKALDENERFDLIVNCTHDIPLPKKHKNSIRIPIDDDIGDCDKLLTLLQTTQVLENIHANLTKKKNVLVHCFAGLQRSPTIIVCYLIQYHGMNTTDAIQWIKRKRPFAFFDEAHFLQMMERFYTNFMCKNKVS
jgi:protein-tyrosine phosphatase